jgi:hypothetical protein
VKAIWGGTIAAPTGPGDDWRGARGALAATKTRMNLETSEMRLNTSTIDATQVTRSFNIKDRSVAILVALGDSGLFSVSFRGMGDDDALTVTKKFNWKAIEDATQPK